MPILMVCPGLMTAQPNESAEHSAGAPEALGALVGGVLGALVGEVLPPLAAGGWVATVVGAAVQANSSMLTTTKTEKTESTLRFDIFFFLLQSNGRVYILSERGHIL